MAPVPMMQQELLPARQGAESLFDWRLDIERLERQARQAVRARRPDDWALVEAECSKDLIEAEMTAIKAKSTRTEATAAKMEHLQSWSQRVDKVIGELRSIADTPDF